MCQSQLRPPSQHAWLPPSLPQAGLGSAQPHMLLQPIPTCLLSPDETTNPSQSQNVFLCVSPKGLEWGGGAGGVGTQQVRWGWQAALAD